MGGSGPPCQMRAVIQADNRHPHVSTNPVQASASHRGAAPNAVEVSKQLMQLVTHKWVWDAIHRESMAIIKLAQELHAEEGRTATSRVRSLIMRTPSHLHSRVSIICSYEIIPRLTCRRSFLNSKLWAKMSRTDCAASRTLASRVLASRSDSLSELRALRCLRCLPCFRSFSLPLLFEDLWELDL